MPCCGWLAVVRCSSPHLVTAQDGTSQHGLSARPLSARIQRWLAYAKQQLGPQTLLIPNVGSWITTRDKTDFSAADGVMIERFGRWNPAMPHDLADWRVQMNRVLSLVRQDKIVIARNVVNNAADVQTRMFLLANYLLVKGQHQKCSAQ